MMSEIGSIHQQSSTPRITQRQPLACLECTRRKVKCDKQVPCSRCRRAGLDCRRERVLVSNVIAKHGGELSFLRQLEEKLLSPQVTVNDLANEISKRISALEAGTTVVDENLSSSTRQDEQTLGRLSPAGVPVGEAFRSNDPNRTPEYAATVTLESLAWGRNYGGCYPHRRCNCYSYRSPSEMISIRSDSLSAASSLFNHASYLTPSTSHAGLLPSIMDSVKLVKFHISHLAWHHGILHTPTFLEQCEIFWSTNTYRHPLWMALYLSVLSSTTWSILNSASLQESLDITIDEHVPQQLFEAMVETLYSQKFLEVVSMYSVQAIVLSTEVAHSIGFSDLNSILIAAAIRLSQCMGLHKITEPTSSLTEGSEQWHEKIEREIGKRVWCQIVIQDHFGLCFTDSFNVNPKHCLTELPINCDDHDLEEQKKSVPTISSYLRTLAQLAKLVPRLFEELGPLWNRKPVREQYRDVMKGDRDMRQLVGEIPSFLLWEDIPEQMVDKPWLDIARRSLAITAAEKIILIHRPFLFPSFQTPNYPYTRSTCVSAATTIAREYANIVTAGYTSFWEHSAYCVTASIILCLQLLYPKKNVSSRGQQDQITEPDQKYYDLVSSTREHLASRRGDIIAKRGVRLIDTMLSVGGFPGFDQTPAFMPIGQPLSQGVTSEVRMDLQKIVTQFLAGDATRMGLSNEGSAYASNGGSPLDIDFGDVDFDTWFGGLFRAQGS